MFKPKFFSLISVLSLALIVLAFQACKDEPEPEPEPEQNCPTTVLVYMAASNSLGSAGYDAKDLAEMRTAIEAGALRGSRLLVYHAASDGTTRLYELTEDGETLITDYSNSTLLSVHGDRMAEVIETARRYAPSDQFGLILWSHGMGWLQNGISDDSYPLPETGKLRSWGDENGRYMNITTLAAVLEDAQPDWVWFDCCLMGNAETVFELRRATPYVVASSIELPPNGMPYDLTLKHLMNPAGADLVEAAKAVFEYYSDALGDDSRTDCAISVYSTSAFDDLATATADIYAVSETLLPTDYKPQYMVLSNRYYADMEHYITALCACLADGDELLAAWTEAFHRAVIYSDVTNAMKTKLGINANCALSTYIYSNTAEAERRNYQTLEWPYRVGIL